MINTSLIEVFLFFSPLPYIRDELHLALSCIEVTTVHVESIKSVYVTANVDVTTALL